MRICIVNITRVPEEHMPAMEGMVRKIVGPILAPGTELFVRAPKNGPTSEFERMADFRDPYFCHLIINQVTETIAEAVRRIGAARVIFGSDWPILGNNQRFGLHRIRDAVASQMFSEDDAEKILGRNAEALLAGASRAN